MAFNEKYLAKVSSSGNGFGPNVWSYNGSTADGADDTAAEIAASGYFNSAQVSLTTATGRLSIGDVINVRGSDANGMYAVTAITTAVTVESYAAIGTVDTAQLAADAVTGAKIEDNAVSLEHLDSGITPSHVIRFAGQPTTAGGAAAEAIAVAGVVATDLAFVQMVDDGTNNTTIVNAVCTTDTLTVTFSADPGADAVINYQIINAAS